MHSRPHTHSHTYTPTHAHTRAHFEGLHELKRWLRSGYDSIQKIPRYHASFYDLSNTKMLISLDGYLGEYYAEQIVQEGIPVFRLSGAGWEIEEIKYGRNTKPVEFVHNFRISSTGSF